MSLTLFDKQNSGSGTGVLVPLRCYMNAMRWPIIRRWVVLGCSTEETVGTLDLAQYSACCLLGSAGLGKTHELRQLAEHERHQGLDVREARLATLATSADRLEAALDGLASGTNSRSVVYLDALDEAMIPLRTTGLIVATWIRSRLNQQRPLFRMSCRSAVWPSAVATAIAEVYGSDNAGIAVLQPLSVDDTGLAAAAAGIDPTRFLGAVSTARVGVLASQPLTLDMLMRVFAERGQLPNSRRSLFEEGVSLLARERKERRELGSVTPISPEALIEAAERLACFSVLSGREVVDLGDSPLSTSLGWVELSNLPGGPRCLDEEVLRAVGSSALCDGDGDLRFCFAHRQLAEYLAGRRLARLLPHQARSVFASGLGWEAGVAGPLRETAAFAAMESREIAEWVAERDPEVVGLSDVADDSLRQQATLRLFERFRTQQMTMLKSGRDGLLFDGLRYRGVEEDLRAVLRERGPQSEDVLECALDMVEAWHLNGLSHELADLFLDPTAPLRARISAGYALARVGGRDD